MSLVTKTGQRIPQDAAAGQQQAAELHRIGQDEQHLRDAQLLLTAKREGLQSADALHVPIDHLDTGQGPVGLIARGEVLVAGESTTSARAILAAEGFAAVSGVGGLWRYRKPGASADEVLALTRRLTGADAQAAPNYVIVAGHTVKFALSPSGPRATFSAPGAQFADDRRGAGVRIAVLDTAVDPADVFARHGLLTGLSVDGLADPDAQLDAAVGHGAFVAGLVRQLAPAAQVQVLTVLAGDGLGTEYALCAALHRLTLAEAAPHVVNLSLSCATPGDAAPVGLPRALDALFAQHPEIVVVAAAGNSGREVAPWPAAHPDVIAVGAVAPDGRPAAYSNRGAWVDFSTPADGVVSAYPPATGAAGQPIDTGFAAWTGTSFAAPQLVGRLAALIGAGRSGPDGLAALRAESTPRPEVGHVLSEA